MSDIINPVTYNGTEVHLLHVPLESDYKHTLFFESPEDQVNYFLSKEMLHVEYCSYQREGEPIRYPKHIDELRICNYMMYRNSNTSDKWFYAFITKMEYENEGMTKIHIETDVMQTWAFDYVVQPSFVEREHVDDDTIGLHTYPEGLETGEAFVNSHFMDETLKELMLVIGITALPDGTKVGGQNYNGIYSGVQYKCCKSTSAGSMTNFINEYDADGRASAIQCIFLAPAFLGGDDFTPTNELVEVPYSSTGSRFYNIERAKNYVIDGYVPRNKKLLCYPYNYLIVSNNNGASALYKYENWIGDKVNFFVYGSITPSCSIRMVPCGGYKNDALLDDEGLNLGKFPICNWQTDVYTNWLTQNSVNNAVAIGSGVAGAGMSAASMLTGNIAGGVSGMVNSAAQVGSVIGQIHAQSFQAPQVNGNLNCGDVITSSQRNTWHFYSMGIKFEYAAIIDDYFDMYGYKVCRVKIPNTNHRESFWYTQTINVNIDGGSIPMEDMLKIKACYNNGITFWKDTMFIGNYKLSNDII